MFPDIGKPIININVFILLTLVHNPQARAVEPPVPSKLPGSMASPVLVQRSCLGQMTKHGIISSVDLTYPNEGASLDDVVHYPPKIRERPY
jgi:hypothetical protein